MAIGTVPVPELIFSFGTAVYIAYVLTKLQSSKFSKYDTPVVFHISAIDTPLDVCTFSVFFCIVCIVHSEKTEFRFQEKPLDNASD